MRRTRTLSGGSSRRMITALDRTGSDTPAHTSSPANKRSGSGVGVGCAEALT